MDSATPFQPWALDGSAKNVKTERELSDDAKHQRENVNPKHTQTASYDKESVTASSAATGSSDAARICMVPGPTKESKMDSAKITSMQQIVENTLSQEGRQRVAHILEGVESLNGAERLLLYLRLPTGVPPHDPLKQPINPLGSRAELQQTVTWIQTHLEVDPEVSLPKQDVYDEYIAHCMSSNMKPLSTADFGKVMKQVYPTVRPRRLGTRGNSRYCYAGLRKKIKLEVPQLPDLGESSKERSKNTRDAERIVCDWAETKLGVKFASLSELSRHVSAQPAPQGPPSASPPREPPHEPTPPHHAGEDPTSRQLIKQLKRKIQTQGTPGRPKKNKSLEIAGESPPSTSYVHLAPAAAVKHESALEACYGYAPAYVPAYDARAPFPYAAPPRAHPPHDYRPDPYAFEPPYAPRDLSVPADAAHNLPINLSSDVSLDLSTERTEWQRRRPPEPPPPRQPLPGKKLILETYQSETQASSPRSSQTAQHATEEYPRMMEYLPKKMRAAEILGGKLAASRHAMAGGDAPSTSASALPEQSVRPELAFLEDPKNLTNRSKSTAAALAREEREAASPTQSVKAPTPKSEHSKGRKGPCGRMREPSPNRAGSPERPATPDSCCGLDGINIKTGMICEEKHSEILNRERVISICNIDKHDLDDYLNEGNSQEHEEELLKYFQHKGGGAGEAADVNTSDPASFLEARTDPHDDHSQGKNEKISQLRELLAKNLKNQSGPASQNLQAAQNNEVSLQSSQEQPVTKMTMSEGAFKPVPSVTVAEIVNGTSLPNHSDMNGGKLCNNLPVANGMSLPYSDQNTCNQATVSGGASLYNGNSHEPQSPTTRTQQYDFVPISDGCHSPGHFGLRNNSPSKMSKQILIGGSLQTSPISHSTAASPFVSPRNTPVPRSRLCPRPIPKHNGRKKRNLLSLGVVESCSKQFAIPTEQKFVTKSSVGCSGLRYCQPMSAPPSPNILSSKYKSQMFHCASTMPNGVNNMPLNFLPHIPFPENMNGDPAQPLSADPLSNEVSQFFQESLITYRPEHDASFRSQSVPLKQGMNNMGLLSYSNTPVGSVPPTPVPNEFCDFGSLADTCDISRAGLNPETLDKIYDAIDSSNDVLSSGGSQTLLSTNDTITNGCDSISEQTILTDDQLNSFIPNNSEILNRSNQFTQSYSSDSSTPQNVEDFLKRTNSIEFDFSDLVNDKNNKIMCNTSRSVPSTPLPHKRTMSNLQIDSRRSRELFAANNLNMSNGICSKSVPSTPQLVEDRTVFSYSNRDFLINGNSVEVCGGGSGGGGGLHGAVADDELTPPLHDDMMILGPLTPAADLLADLDKMDGTPYVDL